MKYKDYIIFEVFIYIDGTSDFELTPPHGEFRVMRSRTTLDSILQEIDEERSEDLDKQIINLKLNCGLAANLLKVYVDTMEAVFDDDPHRFSIEDWDNVVESANFLHRVNSKISYRDFITRIENFISKQLKS